MYLFVDEESIYESSKKIGPSVFVKTAILCQIKAGGAFVTTPRFVYIFVFFLMSDIS